MEIIQNIIIVHPLVSIIIPTYNRAHLIGETLDSVLAQTYPHWECIVVDDGSTDETEKVVQAYVDKDPRFQYHKRKVEYKKGASGSRNYGFELSSGTYVKWLDSDDLLAEMALETYITYIKLNYEPDLIVCSLTYFSKDLKNLIKSNIIPNNFKLEDYVSGRVSFYVSPPLWKKKFLEKQTNLYDQKISNLDDWDFNLRMLYEKPKKVVIQNSLIFYRIHQDSLSRRLEKYDWEEISSEIYTREKHIKLLDDNKLCDSKILRKYIQERLTYLYRESMVAKKSISTKLFFLLLKYKIKKGNAFGVFKSILWFIIFKTIRKGYNYLN